MFLWHDIFLNFRIYKSSNFRIFDFLNIQILKFLDVYVSRLISKSLDFWIFKLSSWRTFEFPNSRIFELWSFKLTNFQNFSVSEIANIKVFEFSVPEFVQTLEFSNSQTFKFLDFQIFRIFEFSNIRFLYVSWDSVTSICFSNYIFILKDCSKNFPIISNINLTFCKYLNTYEQWYISKDRMKNHLKKKQLNIISNLYSFTSNDLQKLSSRTKETFCETSSFLCLIDLVSDVTYIIVIIFYSPSSFLCSSNDFQEIAFEFSKAVDDHRRQLNRYFTERLQELPFHRFRTSSPCVLLYLTFVKLT